MAGWYARCVWVEVVITALGLGGEGVNVALREVFVFVVGGVRGGCGWRWRWCCVCVCCYGGV